MQEANYWLCLDSKLRKSCDALVLWQNFLCRDLVFKRAFSPFKRGRDSATCNEMFTGKDMWMNSTVLQLHKWEETESIEETVGYGVNISDLLVWIQWFFVEWGRVFITIWRKEKKKKENKSLFRSWYHNYMTKKSENISFLVLFLQKPLRCYT